MFKLLIRSYYKLHFLHQDLNRKHRTFGRLFKQKIFFCPSRILIVRNVHRNQFTFNFSRYSNSKNYKLYLFFFSFRVRFRKIPVVERFSTGQLLLGVPCISGLTAQKISKTALFINFTEYANLYSSAIRSSETSIKNSV